jgi:Fur family peroxide stress response transcriptional regulator
MRNTRQRAAILTVLRETESHPTADWIFQEVRKALPQISLGTVYRTLEMLAQEGVVRELDFGPRKRHYDGSPGKHAHVVCLACGRIADVDAPLSPELSRSVSETTGFQIMEQRTEWYGYCPDCTAAHV